MKRLLSAEHFSVDGTMLKAWASMKSFRAKDGSDEPPAAGRNGERDFEEDEAVERDARLRLPTRTRGFIARATARRAVWPISATP